jgi:hypothetical protein
MIINQTLGNLTENPTVKTIDYLDLEWFETTKRIQRKKTRQGVDIAIKFLREGQRLREGDILFEDVEKVIAVNVLETDAIVMAPLFVGNGRYATKSGTNIFRFSFRKIKYCFRLKCRCSDGWKQAVSNRKNNP